MRLPALLACAAVLLVPGCIQGLDDLASGTVGGDCTSDVSQDVSTSGRTLYPDALEGSAAQNPSITIHARPGQTVTAQATWAATGGDVEVDYDGPPGDVTVGTMVTWQLIAVGTGENVTLGLDGDPFAFGTTYTLQLTATGCTPRA